MNFSPSFKLLVDILFFMAVIGLLVAMWRIERIGQSDNYVLLFYKYGQVISISAMIFIGSWLVFHPEFEPHLPTRLIEISASYTGSVIMFLDFFDVHPRMD